MRIIATAFQLPMKFFRFLIALCSIPILLAAETPVRVPLSEAQEKLRGELANKVQISEKILPGFAVRTDDAAPVLHRFYDELRGAGIDVLDLTPLFIQNRDDKRGGVFCKTDSHWSGLGCMLAAQAIAENVREKLTLPS